MRTTTEVVHDHLMRRLEGDLDADLRNYASDIVLLTGSGVYRGHEGVRACAAELDRLVGSGTFTYAETVIDGDYGFLEWTADHEDSMVRDGADSFVIQNGAIVMQSIHYTVRSRE
ncbi:nuclear transport factor 2 family protein [Microbacterium sp. KUDC0406]|uniref:nuclear transport factor 2 family protein n=1 Tax=Microbacterium sp. KUDC0406 TaxID=2909588 RepID=UPI001F26D367|nr:nuclear transport factor 2 family protein [Microbacterium sp. KUDC0406]UJP09238.1 nuclear transport factor 2 family protein [Microbacterium sp. KUDC0406]